MAKKKGNNKAKITKAPSTSFDKKKSRVAVQPFGGDEDECKTSIPTNPVQAKQKLNSVTFLVHSNRDTVLFQNDATTRPGEPMLALLFLLHLAAKLFLTLLTAQIWTTFPTMMRFTD